MTPAQPRRVLRKYSLSYWRRQQGVSGFAAVRVTATPAVTVDGGVIEIDLASGCVRVRGIVEGTMLREVLAATR